MNRRGFIGSILALGMAPAVVRAGVLMRVRPLIVPGDPFFLNVVTMHHFDGAYDLGKSDFTIESWLPPPDYAKLGENIRATIEQNAFATLNRIRILHS